MATYTVMPGDNMWQIANFHGVNLNDLLAANPQITNPTFIYTGQTIYIPQSSTNNNTKTYTVLKGDTMWNIAKQKGFSLNDLLTANPQIKNTSVIYPGQLINIPSETPQQPTTSNGQSTDLEVVRLVNEERVKVGRRALSENSELNRVAKIKANDFINKNYFAHNSPTYGTPFEMLKTFGINFTAAAENIASGQKTAAEVMNSWMNSSGHRTNILNSTYNQIGVGSAKDSKGNTYWVQLFIRS